MNTGPTRWVTFLVSLACTSGFLGQRSETRAADGGQALTTADLLVDLARDHGLRCRGKQTGADALHIKTLLRAALRLDPHHRQAYVWLYELSSRADQQDEAAEMLAQLVAADPANMTAFANWLQAGPPEVQTAEQRRAWLVELLNRQERPENLALLHAHLGRLALQQVDQELARQHLDEAFGLWPECPEALLLGLDLVTAETPPAERLKAVLRVLQANPVQADLAWEAALLLDEYGFAEDAWQFYEHASSLREAGGDRGPLPVQKSLQLSRNALAREQLADARRLALDAAQAEQAQQGEFEARFYLYWLMTEKKLPDAMIEQLRAVLARHFAAIKDPAEWPVGFVSQAAWFSCVVDEQPERALMLAEHAARRAPGDVFVTRVLGWAQALNERTEQARQTLAPIAKIDPYAAYRLAKLLRGAGEEDAAARVVLDLTCIPPVGRARRLLDELGLPAATSQPAEQRFPEIVELLAQFDRTALGFHEDSTRFVEARFELEDSSVAPGEPWWGVFSLTNRGRFPITLGPEWMVNPVFLLSFRVEGDREREYPGLLAIGLDHSRVIRPGQTVSVRRTIDIGPLRKLSRQTPQQMQSVSVTAILDPEQTSDGQWQPSLCGQRLRAAPLVRLPANTRPAAWTARFGALKGESSRARFEALEVMAELLGEHQRAGMKRLPYLPEPIPAERVHQALLSALGSESWETRVRTLDSLQVAGLDRRLVGAAQACLDHPHWAVRLMAVRLLARQGTAFVEKARTIAAEDEDELVRALADSYVVRWSAE